MRPKEIFSKFVNSNTKIDVEKLKENNPELWKKLKKQFDTGREIVAVQLNNGLDKTNENTLRDYLMEYADRFLKYGPKSFPSSFNTLEPFFTYNHHNSILQLHSEEESYEISLIDFYENILENIIYHFSFSTDFDEINFSNNENTFYVVGLSLIRQGNEVSILIQAGESFNKEESEEYFKKNTRSSLEQSLHPLKKTLGMKLTNTNDPKIVYFEERNDLWAHNVGVLFNLDNNKIDIRFVARDDNLSYKILTDDFYMLLCSQGQLSEKDFKEFYENHLKELSNYDAVFDLAKYCLALPYYIFENENRIVDVTYETNLNRIIKGGISKRKYAFVPSEYKILPE